MSKSCHDAAAAAAKDDDNDDNEADSDAAAATADDPCCATDGSKNAASFCLTTSWLKAVDAIAAAVGNWSDDSPAFLPAGNRDWN